MECTGDCTGTAKRATYPSIWPRESGYTAQPGTLLSVAMAVARRRVTMREPGDAALHAECMRVWDTRQPCELLVDGQLDGSEASCARHDAARPHELRREVRVCARVPYAFPFTALQPPHDFETLAPGPPRRALPPRTDRCNGDCDYCAALATPSPVDAPLSSTGLLRAAAFGDVCFTGSVADLVRAASAGKIDRHWMAAEQVTVDISGGPPLPHPCLVAQALCILPRFEGTALRVIVHAGDTAVREAIERRRIVGCTVVTIGAVTNQGQTRLPAVLNPPRVAPQRQIAPTAQPSRRPQRPPSRPPPPPAGPPPPPLRRPTDS